MIESINSRLRKATRNRGHFPSEQAALSLAEAAVEAAERQHTSVPGEKTTAKLVHTLAEEVMALNEQIREMDKLIEGRFREHGLADIILSVPGIGATLGAEFLAAVGGDLEEFDSPDALAAFVGVAPAPRGQGQRQPPQAGRLPPKAPAARRTPQRHAKIPPDTSRDKREPITSTSSNHA